MAVRQRIWKSAIQPTWKSALRYRRFAEVSNAVAAIAVTQVQWRCGSGFGNPRYSRLGSRRYGTGVLQRSLTRWRPLWSHRCNGGAAAALEIRDTADLEVGATVPAFCRGL